ncbi:MAG: preprotein translocase subunit SecA, partial [Patescibacteria group bacterium]|nr:preprotein translocase subunit SecA [Patescibacteria group bacterium]
MPGFFKKILGIDQLSRLKPILNRINELEEEIKKLKDEEIKLRFLKIKGEFSERSRSDLLVEAFALAREAAVRTVNKRPFDVQILGGIVLDEGSIVEMLTGEGKTLAAVAPAAFNALEGKGVHVVTVNEYLARRDAVWMGQIYKFLGLSVSCLVPNGAYLYDPDFTIPKEGEVLADKERDLTGNFLVQQEFLKPVSRREAYLADVTYGTNQEFGFDYLRDNLAYSLEQQAQREPHFAIIDEVDSILIDEARTPLIIAAPDIQSSELYKTFARLVSYLQKETDYSVDEKFKSVSINDSGISKIEKSLGVSNLYSPENLRLTRFLEESLKAKELFRRDKNYVVKNGEILIVDEFTGRLLFGRRYTGGLHQAIEAKEGVLVKDENKTYAQVSIQNYFRLYKKLSGMTGTAQTSAEEFSKVYSLEVVSIPPNQPMVRRDNADLIYKDLKNKWRAIAKEVEERNKKGQPVLIGTASIEHNEHLAELLKEAGVGCEVLNAKNNEREGAIIAQAGKLGAVTVATNMAGRGVDIILGGNPPDQKEADKIK